MKLLTIGLLLSSSILMYADDFDNVEHGIEKTGHVIAQSTIAAGQKLKNVGEKIDSNSKELGQDIKDNLQTKEESIGDKIHNVATGINEKTDEIVNSLELSAIKAKHSVKELAKRTTRSCNEKVETLKAKATDFKDDITAYTKYNANVAKKETVRKMKKVSDVINNKLSDMKDDLEYEHDVADKTNK